MLLAAMALQGLTPDPRDLCSPWLLGLVASAGGPTQPAGSGPSDHDHGGPGVLCIKVDAAACLRAKIDERATRFLAALDRMRSTSVPKGTRDSVRSPSAVERWSDGLMPVLCRFLC